MPADTAQEQIVTYLTDIHATEEHGLSQLRSGAEDAQDERLAGLLRAHLAESETHERLVRERIEALGGSPSRIKDLLGKAAAAGGDLVTRANPDTTGKIAIAAFAYEHLEIASYVSLREVARHTGDVETVELADRILAEEQATADQIEALLPGVALVGLPQS